MKEAHAGQHVPLASISHRGGADPHTATLRSSSIAGMLILVLCATGCASSPKRGLAGADSSPMADAIQQPFEDIGLVRETAPASLTRAVRAPYEGGPELSCATLAQEIAELDQELGPDIDAAARDSDNPISGLVAGAVRGALGLPYRGLVRKVSGAERRDRDHARMFVAGTARRGYLKGLARARQCGEAASFDADQ